MTRRVAIGVAVLAVTAAPAAAQLPPRDAAQQSATARIRGRVTKAGTDQPLSRVDGLTSRATPFSIADGESRAIDLIVQSTNR